MIRTLIYIALLALIAFAMAWFADQPGAISVVWGGLRYEMSPVVGLGILLIATFVLMVLWSLLRFTLRVPTLASITMRMRKRDKGYTALSQGMIAAGAGDVAGANRAARIAEKTLGHEPLALLLKAQTAQISGDSATAEETFKRMADLPATRLFGLRGLYAEACRRGDDATAFAIAEQAHAAAALPWAGQAIIEHHAMSDDWRGALDVVERNFARKTIDRRTADRQRAVLKTGIGLSMTDRAPDEALQMAREAIKLAPDLLPAYVLAGRMLARKGDIRRAAKVLESGWRVLPHPDISAAYLDLRPGDSSTDRLVRAQALARFAPDHRESRLAVARAAIDARDFALARETMAPLLDGNASRPTARICLLMADLEETEYGQSGRMREWLARAARAPRDPAWVADGVISDTWSPASPVTGRIDAFRWETPAERLHAPEEAPLEPLVAPLDLPTPDAKLIEHAASDAEAAMAEAEAPVIVSQTAVVEPAATPAKAEAAPPEAAKPLPFIAAPDDPGLDPEADKPKKKGWFS
ncbi:MULTISPECIES: heme biosynthesis HemY N-terminal domain-containing protein [unclassified Beijerinckia]|uniref:heme biosynthesis protein HemY n=1 Tax=unclassified Beijerinckia TaxID=2638183 RepID=UPI0008989827|nr:MULTISPECIES: heme biosynthesis HemY N-terminal domain-containing protein [unclassified Beijerinckia]MDH7798424.1 HemY protein [Beijerinckia sp. GAS462]SED20402.1 HemY protein [Beijerinckia sp. 28-YEA-48]